MPFCVAQLSSSKPPPPPPPHSLSIFTACQCAGCLDALHGGHCWVTHVAIPGSQTPSSEQTQLLSTEKALLKWLKTQLFVSFPWLRLGRSAVSVQWWVTLITYPQSQIWKGWLHIKLIVLLSKFLQSHARSCLWGASIPNIQPTDLKKKNRKEDKFPLVSWRVWCRIPFFYENRRDHTWLFSFVKS